MKSFSNKKIIALSCSPSRNRNSDSMLDYFINGISEFDTEGLVDVEKIYLDDIKIANYKYENSSGAQNDEKDFYLLTEKLKNADGLIIATPTYNFSVPGHLKNFIDRIRFLSVDLSNRDIFGQPAGKLKNLSTYFLVSGGIPKWAETILFFSFPAFWLRAVFLYYDAKVLGAYYSGDVKTFENKKILSKCQKYGRKYAYKILHNNKNKILERIFWKPKQLE